MNTQRNKEIKAVVTAFTITAALLSGLLTIQDANAAPQAKKSTVTVKRAKKSKPVTVKMTGNRRAAENRASQLYSAALAQKAADQQALVDARNAAQEEAATATAQNTTNAAQNNTGNAPNAYGPQVFNTGIGGFGPTVVAGGYGSGNYGGGIFTFPQLSNSGNFGSFGNGTYVGPPTGGFVYPGGLNFGYGNNGAVSGSGFSFGF